MIKINLKLSSEKIINDKEVFEENNWFTEAKTILDKEKIPYKKLYECIDFKENLLDEEKKDNRKQSFRYGDYRLNNSPK